MLIMFEGGCNIKIKAFNAQKAGAKLVMIVRSQKTHKKMVEETHSLMTNKVEIPTVTVDAD